MKGWQDNPQIAALIQRLVACLCAAPTEADRRARWVRGFVHGYLGLPYEVDGIKHDKHFMPIVYSPDPYRAAFFLGRAERMSRN